jgi:hypothetical protein
MLISTSALFIFTLLTEINTQELPPTEQTEFTYPDDGAGVPLPFPEAIAELTGLSDWPEIWVTPPFTPNMAALYDPTATTVIPDIVAPPNAIGFPPQSEWSSLFRFLSDIR